MSQRPVEAKLRALEAEWVELRSSFRWGSPWHQALWVNPKVCFEDWKVSDAWWRSRCMEFPEIGDAIVPGLDMVNHSDDPEAAYFLDSEGNACTDLLPGVGALCGSQITISYGEDKSMAEMLYSYGFFGRNADWAE